MLHKIKTHSHKTSTYKMQLYYIDFSLKTRYIKQRQLEDFFSGSWWL